MILYFRALPRLTWYWRAIFIAASVASDPPETNLTAPKPGGAKSISTFASSMATGLVPWSGGANAILFNCSVIASMIARLPCPRLTVKTPASPSMYSRPSVDLQADAVGLADDERILGELLHLHEVEDQAHDVSTGRGVDHRRTVLTTRVEWLCQMSTECTRRAGRAQRDDGVTIGVVRRGRQPLTAPAVSPAAYWSTKNE